MKNLTAMKVALQLQQQYHYDQKCCSQPKKSELFAVIGTQHRRPVELFLRLQQQRFLFTELFLNYSSSRLCMCA